MTVDHSLTKLKIEFIISTLRDMAKVAKAYKTAKTAVETDETRSEEFKKQSIEELRNTYNTKREETKTTVIKKLNEILEIEEQNEKAFEFDNEDYKTALATIEAAKGNINAAVIESFKLHFAGHYQLLLSIKSALKSCVPNIDDYKFDDYTRAAETEILNLTELTDNMEYDEVAVVPYISRLHNHLLHFARVRGIELDENYKTFGEELDDAGNTELARRAMGLA